MSDAAALAPADDRIGAPVPMSDFALARAQVAALEEMLEVHERTAYEQATRLEQALRGMDELLQRERAARAAQDETDQRLRLALDAGRMGTWEWDIAGGRVVWSVEEERLYGLPEGSFGGTLEEYASRVHPDDRAASMTLVQEALARRAPTHHVMHRIVRPDGEVRWLDSHGRFLYADDGRPLRLVGVSTDVTDRLAMEEARDRAHAEARAERERLYEVFMQAPAAIAVVEGPEHRFTVSNELYRELVGDRPLIGRTVVEAFPELVGQGFIELLDSVFASGEAFVAKEASVLLDRDRSGTPQELFVDFVYQPLRDAAGQSFGVMVHAVEVTETVRARQLIEQRAEELTRLTRELEQSNRELDQFAYVASHDLKAPLRGIANLTQWIEEDLGARITGESREHMRLLKGRVHRMEALIDGILAYSRAGRAREKAESVDVGALLRESIELLAPPDGVEIVIGPGMPTLRTERVPLQQVFLNLVGNAVKYTPAPGARIEISATRRDDCWEFAVADNGPGIAPQYRERIWQIFQTLAARDKVEGTGIGLSVVRKIVESRGGRAWLDDESERGATFRFTWPLTPATVP